MIDPADKKTKNLPLEQPKRGRGRPSTGTAMTPAEKQKAYRERIKHNVTQLERERDNAYATSRVDEYVNDDLHEELAEAKKENVQLLKLLDDANKEKKYWIDRALKAEKKKRHRDEPPGKLKIEDSPTGEL